MKVCVLFLLLIGCEGSSELVIEATPTPFVAPVRQPRGVPAQRIEVLAPHEKEESGKLTPCWHVEIVSWEALWYTEVFSLGPQGAYVGNNLRGGSADLCATHLWFRTLDTNRLSKVELKEGLWCFEDQGDKDCNDVVYKVTRM